MPILLNTPILIRNKQTEDISVKYPRSIKPGIDQAWSHLGFTDILAVSYKPTLDTKILTLFNRHNRLTATEDTEIVTHYPFTPVKHKKLSCIKSRENIILPHLPVRFDKISKHVNPWEYLSDETILNEYCIVDCKNELDIRLEPGFLHPVYYNMDDLDTQMTILLLTKIDKEYWLYKGNDDFVYGKYNFYQARKQQATKGLKIIREDYNNFIKKYHPIEYSVTEYDISKYHPALEASGRYPTDTTQVELLTENGYYQAGIGKLIVKSNFNPIK